MGLLGLAQLTQGVFLVHLGGHDGLACGGGALHLLEEVTDAKVLQDPVLGLNHLAHGTPVEKCIGTEQFPASCSDSDSDSETMHVNQ